MLWFVRKCAKTTHSKYGRAEHNQSDFKAQKDTIIGKQTVSVSSFHPKAVHVGSSIFATGHSKEAPLTHFVVNSENPTSEAEWNTSSISLSAPD